MKIKHEHIRMAIDAWLLYPKVTRKEIADAIAKAYFELEMDYPVMHNPASVEGMGLNIQNIFRWIKKDTPEAVRDLQALLPAIEKAMPPLLVAYMRSHSSDYFRELVETRERLVRDADDFVAVAITGFNQMNRGGPAGNAVVMH